LDELAKADDINTIHLNYTGGTKPMSLYGNIAVSEWIEKEKKKDKIKVILSDIDPKNHKIVLRDKPGYPLDGDLLGKVELKIETVLDLHDMKTVSDDVQDITIPEDKLMNFAHQAIKKYRTGQEENSDVKYVYEWFVANKQIKGSGTSPVIHQTLPEIRNPSLKSYTDISERKTILVRRFAPLFLTVRNIGPFFEKPVIFDFTAEDGTPCNFYLLVSENGRGKTTVLELMVFLMKILEYDTMESFGHDGLDKNYGSVQWDILVKFSVEEKDRQKQERTVVLSLLAGSFDRSVISEWDAEHLKNVGATSWHQFGFWRNESGSLERLGQNDSFVSEFLNEMRTKLGDELIGFEGSVHKEDSILTKNPTMNLPVLLYFSAYRDIPPVADKEDKVAMPENWKSADWGYRCIRQFSQEGTQWRKSADNLFTWLGHINDGRFELARNIVNDRVFRGRQKFFKGMQKNPPEAIIHNQGRQHSFDKLSSGEKSLLQLFSCIGVYMTRNTILLIDEMDAHLHSKWQHRVLNLLKGLVKDHPGLTVIATTHSREILSAFAYEIKEDKLRKGGDIIEEELY